MSAVPFLDLPLTIEFQMVLAAEICYRTRAGTQNRDPPFSRVTSACITTCEYLVYGGKDLIQRYQSEFYHMAFSHFINVESTRIPPPLNP